MTFAKFTVNPVTQSAQRRKERKEGEYKNQFLCDLSDFAFSALIISDSRNHVSRYVSDTIYAR